MRQRFLAGAVALATLTAAAGMVAAQNRADTPNNPFAGDAAAAAAGRTAFNATCAACHGPNASGTDRAPSLAGSLKHGGEDYEIFQTIHNGVPGTQMPSFAALPPEDLWRLVTFVKSLSGTPTGARPAGAAAAVATKGDVAAGQALFFGKGQCAACHEVNGRGAVIAPDLSAIGASADLRGRILHPPPRGGFLPAPPFQFVDVVTKDGRRLNGVVKLHDSAVLHLQSRDGAYHLLTNDHVASITPVPGGGPPTDVALRLSPAEMDDLVAYLSQQRGRDLAQTAKAQLPVGLTAERLAHARAEPQNWLTHWGDYQGDHYSDLAQITPANVAQLQARWIGQTPYDRPFQSTPLVVDGVLYTTGAPGDVYAFDARSGAQLWKFHRNQDKRNPYQINPNNRGVAVTGGRVFFATLDNNLIAIDARSGREVWEKNLADTMQGYNMTGAPLAVNGMVVTGVSGGEFGVRGFLEAYDAATGAKLWRFDAIPQPGQPGSETWPGDSWKTGGGGMWLTGSYDPELNLVYWAVGNPGPVYNPASRKGDNLYTCSVVALDPKTGKLVWHYQFTPNDGHDWDAAQDMVLADRMVDGRMRKVLLQADRNGFYYMLDRTNGKFISAHNFVTQTWNDGFDANGRPKVRPDSYPTPQGVPASPALGATNFQAPSYDRYNGLSFFAYQDAEQIAVSADQAFEPGKLFYGRGDARGRTPSRASVQGVMAWDPAKGQPVWKFPLSRASLGAGVLATKGGLVFAGSGEGWLYALDERTGRPLWRFYTGGGINASPISYAVDGRQYVAISAGPGVISFALPQ